MCNLFRTREANTAPRAHTMSWHCVLLLQLANSRGSPIASVSVALWPVTPSGSRFRLSLIHAAGVSGCRSSVRTNSMNHARAIDAKKR
jgi:hypothetical protein